MKIEIEIDEIDHDFLTAVAAAKGQTISETIAEIIDQLARREAQIEPLEEIQGGLQGILEEMRQVLAPASLKLLAAGLEREVKQ